MSTTRVEPFTIAVPEGALDDLRDRLHRTRWPEPATADGWAQGPPLEVVRELCRTWADDYDWRATEARLNRLPQVRTELDGLGVHALHLRSDRDDAPALLLTTGWPGSFLELEQVLEPLRADFHVVVPSLPGYGFSDRPARAGWGVERIADAWAELMSRLGYDRFVAQGTDWGTTVSTELGMRHRERIIGLHLVPPLVPPDPATTNDPPALTDAERRTVEALQDTSGDGYALVQSTRPQTIGYGLVDSPALLCAWIVEKLQAWTDGDLTDLVRTDRILDNLTLYWVTATGASAARLYWESFPAVRERFRAPVTDVVDVPVGCSVFPAEMPRPSRRWAARRFPDIRYWSEPPRGGHFPALEQPALFVAEVRACVRALLDGTGRPG